MPPIVDQIRTFRGSRPAKVIAVVLLLGTGVYDLFLNSGQGSQILGLIFIVLGLVGAYSLLVENSATESDRAP